MERQPKRALSPCERYFRLCGISILSYEVCRVAGKEYVIDFAFGSTSDPDHFAGLNEMVFWLNGGISTRFTRFHQRLSKITPIGISENLLKVAGTPKFYSVR